MVGLTSYHKDETVLDHDLKVGYLAVNVVQSLAFLAGTNSSFVEEKRRKIGTVHVHCLYVH
jgi:hypothetical protein